MTRRISHRLLAAGLVGAIAVAACLNSAAATAGQPSARCTFEAPSAMQRGAMRWFGRCQNGRAEGLGVLRVYTRDGAGEAFYGEFVAGGPRIGVIETAGGFVAGRFSGGVVIPSSEAQTFVDAFRAAARAAMAASTKLRAEGNMASADFYARKAKQLGAALD